MFSNEPKAFSEPYRRYLLGVFREHLPFAEVPIKLYLRKRQSGDRRADIETDADEAPPVYVPPADDDSHLFDDPQIDELPESIDETHVVDEMPSGQGSGDEGPREEG